MALVNFATPITDAVSDDASNSRGSPTLLRKEDVSPMSSPSAALSTGHKSETLFPFTGRVLMIGFGSIGKGVLPLLRKHFAIRSIHIVCADVTDVEITCAKKYDAQLTKLALTENNYLEVLNGKLSSGDFLVNLSVDVSSLALIEFAQSRNAMYIDTCVEPWAGGYTDTHLPLAERTNYALREKALALRGAGKSTAVIANGANPGLVSHFAKQALLNLARDTGMVLEKTPTDKAGWAKLAQDLGVKVIHIAERDTQISNIRKARGEFVNTWSVDGFVSEGAQPAELGWGTHEKALPSNGHEHKTGSKASIYLAEPGANVNVRSWTPLEQEFIGFLITHHEAISLADFLTVKNETGEVVYRPTCHYAYSPCDDAILSLHEFKGKALKVQDKKRILTDDILPGGQDALGVMLAGHAKNCYWYGSQLSIDEARKLAPYNSATSLQVTSTIIAGMVWAMEKPGRGVVEVEEMEHDRILEIATPYLGKIVGEYSNWTPLDNRGILFEEDIDREDPWQFKNIKC